MNEHRKQTIKKNIEKYKATSNFNSSSESAIIICSTNNENIVKPEISVNVP